MALRTCMKLNQPLNCLNLFYRSYAFRWRSESSSKVEATKSSEEAATNGATSETPEVSIEMAECLRAKEVLTEKVSEINDKYMRALAETENVRNRMQRQIDDAKLFGIQGFCKDLLDVADVLQKATVSIPSDVLEQNSHLKSLFEGVQMTDLQLQKVFKKHGLYPIDPLGEKFNPNYHEALFEQPIEGKDPGTIAVVTKIGYKLHERTIRPALVGVVKAK